MSLLLTLNYLTPFSSVSIDNFEHVNPGWVNQLLERQMCRKYIHCKALSFHTSSKKTSNPFSLINVKENLHIIS